MTGLNSKATELLYGGAAGGGKSHLLRVAAIIWCLFVPGLQVYLFRRTYPELVSNHLDGAGSFPILLAELIGLGKVKINYSSLEIQFSNGSKIHLCHCQHEKDVYKYQGAEIHVLLIDELTHFTEKMYRYLRGRCRVGGLKIPTAVAERWHFPRIVAGTNPGGIGHNWVKAAFVDNAPEGQIKAMPKKEGGMQRQYLKALTTDNKHLDDDYEDKLQGLGDEMLVRAMLEADWDIVSGGMFDDVWKRDIHVVKPFAIPSSWAINRSFDWGSSKPFSVGWWAESDGTEATLADGTKRHFPRGTLFRIDEWYGSNGKPDEGLKMLAVEIAREVVQRDKQWKRVEPGPADSSIFDVENGMSIAADMQKAKCLWTRADKSPGSRKTGWEKLRRYLKAAKDGNKEEPGIYIFEHCRDWIRTIPTLPRDEKDRDDVNTKAEDHAADETRYRLLSGRVIGAY